MTTPTELENALTTVKTARTARRAEIGEKINEAIAMLSDADTLALWDADDLPTAFSEARNNLQYAKNRIAPADATLTLPTFTG